jgi:uncharacterized protein
MLRSFRLANHRSFADEQELSLLPVYDRELSALPVAAVYGANASGKSNLLDGLTFMQDAVLRSFQSWDADGGVPRRLFRLDPALRTAPSLFVVDLMIDGVRYTYGFSADSELILEEWLYSYPEKKKRVLFERTGNEIKFGSTVHEVKGKLDALDQLTRSNALFLSLSAQLDLEYVVPVSRWFRSGLKVRRSRGWRPDRIIARRVSSYLRRHQDDSSALTELLAVADVGISDLVVVDEPDPASLRPGGGSIQKLMFVHGNPAELFELDDESDGTRSWLSLLVDVLDVLDAGGTLLVDEIDASLHPLLTARLIGLFRDEEINPHGGQLIFTTHDASLLGTMLGDEIFGRDQIWFVEKSAEGASRLYPLSDFKPREGENRERRYLGGSYGAVPVLSPQQFADAVRGR